MSLKDSILALGVRLNGSLRSPFKRAAVITLVQRLRTENPLRPRGGSSLLLGGGLQPLAIHTVLSTVHQRTRTALGRKPTRSGRRLALLQPHRMSGVRQRVGRYLKAEKCLVDGIYGSAQAQPPQCLFPMRGFQSASSGRPMGSPIGSRQICPSPAVIIHGTARRL
ncbi:hypothetical protein FA13DRAFT_1127140 [Coprinellus micaceus]|uniref:Uncharacterized protein n=1 Tax=Coprinellus micaceus TaxID=71717 RepID=A0A4Y7RJC9_COPMI|nr:hypothetical protein FA13DRAFT_1127140 [Coprinellus micaceus]